MCGMHFVFLIIVELIKNGIDGDGSCAISLKSMTKVKSCPSNKIEVEASSKRKNCSQYIVEDAEKTCSDYKRIKYHCVINEYGDGLIEVCAPERVIKGFCAEFVEGKGKIQGHNYLECTGCLYNPPCPHYKSSTAYLYQDCYNLSRNVKLIQDLKDGIDIKCPKVTSKYVTERPTLTSKESLATPAKSRIKDWWIVIAGTCISFVILISIVALFVVLCLCHLPRPCVDKKHISSNENEVDMKTPCMPRSEQCDP